MQFTNEGQRVQLTVLKVKFAAKDSATRLVSIEFALAVGLSESQFMPPFLKDAWSAMRKSGSQARETDLEGEIPSQNVRFYRLDKDKSVDIELTDVTLKDLRLEKAANQIFLHFTIQELVGKKLWDWCWYAFARTVFAEFEEGQMELPARGEDDDNLKVTLSSPGLGSVETTTKGLREAAKRIARKAKAAGE